MSASPDTALVALGEALGVKITDARREARKKTWLRTANVFGQVYEGRGSDADAATRALLAELVKVATHCAREDIARAQRDEEIAEGLIASAKRVRLNADDCRARAEKIVAAVRSASLVDSPNQTTMDGVS